MAPSGITQRALWRERGLALAEGAVAVEEPLEIRVASEPVAITMRTPGEDAHLAVGFLFAEGLVRSIDEVGAIAHCGRPGEEGFGNVIDVTAAPGVVLETDLLEATRRGTLTTSACGVCGRRTIDDLLASLRPLAPGDALSRSILAGSTRLLASAQAAFPLTGGSHAAAVLDEQGSLLACAEDVGRHNAVDKVIGALLYDRLLPLAPRPGAPLPRLLVVSGRASFEIIQKSARAALPVVACVSAPTSLAIDLALRTGITLAAFVRDGEFNLYSFPERITG